MLVAFLSFVPDISKHQRPIFLNAVYVRQGITCNLLLTNDLIDGGQRVDGV